MSAESEAHEFAPDDLKYLHLLADRIAADVEWYGARLVVEVYDKADSRPVAWIENYPGDSNPVVRFSRADTNALGESPC